MYRVEIEFAPAYELVISLEAYLNRQAYRTRELGADWAARVRETLDPTFVETLRELRGVPCKPVLDILIRQCTARNTVQTFLQWLDGLSAGDIYACIAPSVPTGAPWLPRDLGAMRDHIRPLLTAWNDQYFRHIDPAILAGLAADTAARLASLEMVAPDVVVETATNGVYLEPVPELDRVLLIPQYHYRPWNLTFSYHRMRLFHYSVDALPPGKDEPPPGLHRMTQALADDMRLRLLRFLAMRPQSFGAIVAWARIPKSTVHYHLVALRAAGLIRIHDRSRGNDTFSLRLSALVVLNDHLHSFLGTADTDEQAG